MFDRFSSEDRTLFMFATQEARDLGHSTLGGDHMILAMTCNARSPLFALLGEQGITLDGARDAVKKFHATDASAEAAASADDAAGRYEEDRDALRSIGIDLDRVRDAVRDKFGDDLADGWGERPRRGRGRGPRGRGDWTGPFEEFDMPGRGRGRRGPRGRGRPRATEYVREAMRAAVRILRSRGDRELTGAHLLLGLLDVNDPAVLAVIEPTTDVETLRTAVTELLDSQSATV